MATNNEWLNLRRAARVLGISAEELVDAVLEGWAPPHEFTRTHAIRFRWADAWLWKLADGWRHRAYRQGLLYAHWKMQA